MRLHDTDIGKDVEDDIEILHVMGRLQHPIVARVLPVQNLQKGEHVLIALRVILFFEPAGVAGHVHQRFRCLAHEGQVEQEDLLFRRVVFDGMNGEKLRRQIADRSSRHLRGTFTAPGIPLPFATEGDRIQRLP